LIANKLKLSKNSALILSVNRFYSSDNNDDPKVKAKEKLNSLLQDLSVADSTQSSLEPKLARPRPAPLLKRSKDGKPKSEKPSTRDLEQDVVRSAQEVANLSSKKVKTDSELLLELKQVSKETNYAKKENEVSGEDLESIFSGLKVDRPLSKQKEKVSKVLKAAAERQEKDLSMEQMAFLQKRAKLRREKNVEKMSETSVDLTSGIPLGIFDGPMTQSSDSNLLPKWRACNQRELEILSTPPPRNALEEMIVQTKQGKLWQFPIDNEQGLDYSEDPFYNHVFLEHNLEDWCPKSGPVRNFMETVCLGLSQNPYMSAQKKVDTIMWFREYFERPENNEILVHSGCWEEESVAN